MDAALVAPDWAHELAGSLGVPRIGSYAEALTSRPRRRLVVLDQAARGSGVANRRDAIGALAARHGELLVVSYTEQSLDYLEPFAEDGPVPTNLTFAGPDATLGELAAWIGTDVPAHRTPLLAFGSDYLRKQRPVARSQPFAGFKRVYVALDPAGAVAVAGAFALGYGPLAGDWVCGHEPRHDHLGPDCYDGFSAYRYREDALAFRAPDAAVAAVEFTGTVIGADSAVTKCGMRGEHQQVTRLDFPPTCGCGAAATTLAVTAPDDEGYAELRPTCETCAADSDRVTAAQLGQMAGIPVGWLDG